MAQNKVSPGLFPQGLELHSDDNNITRNINFNAEPVSTSVDTVKLLLQRLAWNVNVLNVPLVRSVSYMEAGKAVCVINKIKTPERGKKYLFSMPLSFFESQKLYQLVDLPPIPAVFLDNQGAVKSIHGLINSQPHTSILTPVDYSYGERIDQDIKQINKHQNIPIANDSYFNSFFKMLAFKRTDYAIIFPSSIYRNFGDDIKYDARAYEIAGNPKYTEGRFWCSKSEESRQALEMINKVAKTLYSDPEFVQMHTAYLPEQSAAFIQKIIKQHASRVVMTDD